MAERVLDIDSSPPIEAHPALLDRHAGLLDAGLRKSAPRTRLLRQMSAYHLGWTDTHGHPANDPAGKRIRPALALWACESLGGEAAWALPAAVAVELIHNFTLIHDDIQDGDQLRRHRPTVWTIWGAEQGINAGDGMFANALSGLLAPGPRPGRRMCCSSAELGGGAGGRRPVSRPLLEGCGSAGDLSAAGDHEDRGAPGCRDGWRSRAGGRTARGRPAVRCRRQVARAGVPGARRLAGTWGDPQVTGKGRSGDLRRRKLTYPVVAAYEGDAGPASRRSCAWCFRDREPGGGCARCSTSWGGPALTAGVPMVLARDSIAALTGLPDEALTDFADLAIHVAERNR